MHKTAFVNGLVFEAAAEGDTWITRIVQAPSSAGGDVQAGDILFGHVGTATQINDRTSLPEIIEKVAAGEADLTFAVSRDGNVWAVSLPYSAAATN